MGHNGPAIHPLRRLLMLLAAVCCRWSLVAACAAPLSGLASRAPSSRHDTSDTRLPLAAPSSPLPPLLSPPSSPPLSFTTTTTTTIFITTATVHLISHHPAAASISARRASLSHHDTALSEPTRARNHHHHHHLPRSSTIINRAARPLTRLGCTPRPIATPTPDRLRFHPIAAATSPPRIPSVPRAAAPCIDLHRPLLLSPSLSSPLPTAHDEGTRIARLAPPAHILLAPARVADMTMPIFSTSPCRISRR